MSFDKFKKAQNLSSLVENASSEEDMQEIISIAFIVNVKLTEPDFYNLISLIETDIFELVTDHYRHCPNKDLALLRYLKDNFMVVKPSFFEVRKSKPDPEISKEFLKYLPLKDRSRLERHSLEVLPRHVLTLAEIERWEYSENDFIDLLIFEIDTYSGTVHDLVEILEKKKLSESQIDKILLQLFLKNCMMTFREYLILKKHLFLKSTIMTDPEYRKCLKKDLTF